MIPEKIDMAWLRATYPGLEAIAIGTGLSFLRNFRSDIFGFDHSDRPRMYGCSFVPNMINGLTAYAYGDRGHRKSIPDPTDGFHRDCSIYAYGEAMMKDSPHMKSFYDLELPHGCTSGGMAMSLACLHFNYVGLIGFDGNLSDFKAGPIKHQHYIENFRFIINYWQNRGRTIVSLMSESVHNDILVPIDKTINYVGLVRAANERIV